MRGAAPAVLALAVCAALSTPARADAARPAQKSEKAPVLVSVAPVSPVLYLAGRGDSAHAGSIATFSNGLTRDISLQARWRAERPDVVDVRGDLVSGKSPGATDLVADYRGKRIRMRVQVGGPARERIPSFRYDVQPVLTLAGCNQGSCHGNAEGRGGLKLSLLGEDPDADYRVLALHGGGRRLNRAAPERSLMLLKSTAAVAHGGGARWTRESAGYRTIALWLQYGAPADDTRTPELRTIRVSPAERIQSIAARLQRLDVVAEFSDGSLRTVTDLARLSTGEPDVELRPGGVVVARKEVDAPVLVSYAGALRTVRLTWISDRKDYRWSAPPAANWIDELNYERLRQLRLRPSNLASDTEFLRRIYLDLLGVLPRPEEVESFLEDPLPDRRTRLIDRLLTRPEFTDYWALKLSDVLRLEERTLDPKGARSYWEWIRGSLASNKPWDEFVRELLTARGSTYSNPPANYYRRTRTSTDLAEATAQLFLGTRLLCARCHNHPFEQWRHRDFYTLAAYFDGVERRMPVVGRRDRFDLHELIGEELVSSGGGMKTIFPKTGERLLPALPGWLPASELSAPAPGEDERLALARWVTSPRNDLFARASVNRFWYYLFGRGLVDPVDDLRESNPASNPALLDRLARHFVSEGFDLRSLLRIILNSTTYQLSSEPNETNRDDERNFSRAIVRRLPAEVLLDAVSQATGVPEEFPGMPHGSRAVEAALIRTRKPFLTLFGQPPRESVCECERGDESTLRQSFALISGAELNGRLAEPENRLGRLLRGGASPERDIALWLVLLGLGALWARRGRNGSENSFQPRKHADVHGR